MGVSWPAVLQTLLFFSCHTASHATTIIYMHGILAGPYESSDIKQFIDEYLPGTTLISINAFNHAESLENLTAQIIKIALQMQEIMDLNPEGVHLLCFSQGGMICRAVVQMLPKHNVKNFIALSCPLAGQYGVTDFLAPYLPYKDRRFVWKALYTEDGQKLSIAAYWNDPHHQSEFDDARLQILLAVLNNQTANNMSYEFKKNFMRLSNLVLIGGPDDGVITPWQSSQFGFYSENETVLAMEQQQFYEKDSFGLQTLDSRGGVHRYTIPDIFHIMWHRNLTVFKCCILPWLT